MAEPSTRRTTHVPASSIHPRWRSPMLPRNQSLTRGVLAGALGGLVASWVMNLFITAAKKAQQAAESAEEQAREQAQQNQQDSEDSTMKVADTVTWIATGHHLSKEGKQKGGPIVHYAFGTLMGAIY